MFRVKAISFFGNRKSILCQNENGPCPLLAIANVLVLRGMCHFPLHKEFVTLQELIDTVADKCLESSTKSWEGSSEDGRAELLNSIFAILPILSRGLDVNIKFLHAEEFEYTQELSVFDAFGIPLFHGWVLDPQDTATLQVIGKQSYNEMLVNSIQSTEKDKKIINNFLRETSSQLTYLGLLQINQNMQDHHLGVFFRNNHFSTVFKTGGQLYLLVTDIGYLEQENVVWELLDDITGDTEYANSAFILSSRCQPAIPLYRPSTVQDTSFPCPKPVTVSRTVAVEQHPPIEQVPRPAEQVLPGTEYLPSRAVATSDVVLDTCTMPWHADTTTLPSAPSATTSIHNDNNVIVEDVSSLSIPPLVSLVAFLPELPPEVPPPEDVINVPDQTTNEMTESFPQETWEHQTREHHSSSNASVDYLSLPIAQLCMNKVTAPASPPLLTTIDTPLPNASPHVESHVLPDVPTMQELDRDMAVAFLEPPVHSISKEGLNSEYWSNTDADVTKDSFNQDSVQSSGLVPRIAPGTQNCQPTDCNNEQHDGLTADYIMALQLQDEIEKEKMSHPTVIAPIRDGNGHSSFDYPQTPGAISGDGAFIASQYTGQELEMMKRAELNYRQRIRQQDEQALQQSGQPAVQHGRYAQNGDYMQQQAARRNSITTQSKSQSDCMIA